MVKHAANIYILSSLIWLLLRYRTLVIDKRFTFHQRPLNQRNTLLRLLQFCFKAARQPFLTTQVSLLCHAPREVQEEAFRKGLIPYIPDE